MITTTYLPLQQELSKQINMIDLGLLSGTLWGDRNLGSLTTEEPGNYYRFGEIIPFTKASSTYKLITSTNIAGTKYDAATSILGGNYHIPTFEQIEELIDYCSWKWITKHNINGIEVTGPNGSHIFLPAGGYIGESLTKTDGLNTFGLYWSELQSLKDFSACLKFHPNHFAWDCFNPSFGFPIRPVIG